MARVFREKRKSGKRKMAAYIAFAICVLALVWHLASSLGASESRESERIAREALIRATVQCYALEGRYPPGIEYLEQHYGLALDRHRFVYHYRAIGENIMPDIRVFPLEG
ncbi:MAG: hypothetical protein LBD12_03055 [Clostridiales Family XIII bacterium]|jgi:hypothetical protein|nr:hypothetical protein [Clostridiales Family XIII bacterium]